jgi:hypothetical protein
MTEPTPPERGRGWTPLRVISLVAGSVLGLTSLALLAGAGVTTWATNTQRDAAGFITTDVHDIVTSSVAVTSEDIDFEWGGPMTPADVLGDVRVRATAIDPARAVFIGVAPKASVDAYLAGASHAVVTSWWPFRTSERSGVAAAAPGAPTAARIWTEQVSGVGTQTLTWRPHSGTWVLVVMNANGRPGVSVSADVGITAPDLKWVAVGLFIAGGLLLGVSVLLIAIPVARASRR